MTLIELSATEALQKIRDGEITSEELVQACLDRIGDVDAGIEAWAHLNPDFALEQARALDKLRAAGGPVGPLHGIPVGIKDIFDTEDFPTENGTVLDSGRQPVYDSKVVSLLKEAGAVIMGKTVSTELAVFGPGKTKNPHNPAHTPGGSSSGSAAAVASHMVPLAIGTQTNGSIIRPASFCGIVGFKPTHGLIPRTGVLDQSAALDTVGSYARSIEDIALLTEVMIAHDAGDKYTRARAHPNLSEMAAGEPPMNPVIAFAKTAVWDQADKETQASFTELAELLGDDCTEIELPEAFDNAVEWHRNIMNADIAKSYAGYYERGKDKLSGILCEMFEYGQKVSAVDFNNAIKCQGVLNSALNGVFDNFDIIITPATTGAAPVGLEATGNPVFSTLFTYTGVPAITLPLMEAENGLPVGVQVVGRRSDDARLLRAANWLMARVGELA